MSKLYTLHCYIREGLAAMRCKGYLTVKPRFWVFVFTLIIAAFSCIYWANQSYQTRQEAELAALQAEHDALQAQRDALQSNIEFTATDTYIEREARGKLGLVKPEEVLFESNE